MSSKKTRRNGGATAASNNKNSMLKRTKRAPPTPDQEVENKNIQYIIVHRFIEILDLVKLFHWQTKSYAAHKALDDLYSKLNEHIDKFVEVQQGKDQGRFKQLSSRIVLNGYDNQEEFMTRIFNFREFLTDLPLFLDNKRDSDLLNIKDEILGDINQFLYLMTFDK